MLFLKQVYKDNSICIHEALSHLLGLSGSPGYQIRRFTGGYDHL